MNKYSYRFRIYPNKQQEILMNKHFGACRFIYNYFLEQSIKSYKETKKTPNYYENCKNLTILKKEKLWLYEIGKGALQYTLRNLDDSYKNFFRSLKRKDNSYNLPKFKNKYSKSSFHIPENIKIKDNKIFIAKFQEGIKIVLDRNINDRIRNCTILRTKSKEYYAILCFEGNIKKLPRIDNIIAIDCNTKQIVCTDGKKFIKFDNPLPMEKYKKKYRKLSKEVSRKQLNSKSRYKAQLKLNKFLQYCTDVREDFQHKLSKKIINENQVIIIENLNIEHMTKRDKFRKISRNTERKRNRLLKDSSLSNLLYKLDYKSLWYDRELIKVDRYFPSSKLCSKCGNKNDKLKLERKWKCEICFTKHDRDENACINLLTEGLRIKTAGVSGLADRPDVRLVHEQSVGSEILFKDSSSADSVCQYEFTTI